MTNQKSLYLFGGERSWKSDDWTASDDRVRGGKSQSYFDCSSSIGRFHGELDIKTLGGAGFASQRTTGEDREWNLSNYAGIELDVAHADSKRYTFILKDELLSKNPQNGREQATISYEYDFEPSTVQQSAEKSTSIFIPWKNLTPTYRGKGKKDAAPIDLTSVKRISIMMRSFFGTQEGPFSLSLRSIKAITHSPTGLREAEEGGITAARTGGRWERYSQSFLLALTPWKMCGLAFVIAGLFYAQHILPRRQ